MSSTLVTTKFSVPRVRGALVPRPRLAMLMDAGAEAALTLVSAPAGFGKTTVLASWLARASTEPRTVAFVSLDESDSQAASFWLYVVTALNSAAPGVGASVLPLLAAGQPATRTLLTAVLNEVGAQRTEVDLILDDYHLADGAEVAEGMTFLLEHRPPNLHVVVSTRADPDLPLARLRARGELVEIRARDLRFTIDGDRGLPDRRRRPARRSRTRCRPSSPGPRGGRPRCSWPPCRCRAGRTSATSSQGSPGPIATSSTTSWTRCCPASPTRSATSWSGRRSSTCSAATCATPSSNGPAAGRCSSALERANLFLVPLDDQRQLVPVPPPVRRRPAGAPAQRAAGDSSPGCTCAPAAGTTMPGEPVPAVRHALAGGRRRPGCRPRRGGDARAAAQPAGGHAPALGRRLPGRGRPAPPGPRHRVRRRPDVQQRVRATSSGGSARSSGSCRRSQARLARAR